MTGDKSQILAGQTCATLFVIYHRSFVIDHSQVPGGSGSVGTPLFERQVSTIPMQRLCRCRISWWLAVGHRWQNDDYPMIPWHTGSYSAVSGIDSSVLN